MNFIEKGKRMSSKLRFQRKKIPQKLLNFIFYVKMYNMSGHIMRNKDK